MNPQQTPQEAADARLLAAASCGCVLSIRHAISNQQLPASIHATDADGNSALHLAAMRGHAAAVIHLGDSIDVKLRNTAGKTSLEVHCIR